MTIRILRTIIIDTNYNLHTTIYKIIIHCWPSNRLATNLVIISTTTIRLRVTCSELIFLLSADIYTFAMVT